MATFISKNTIIPREATNVDAKKPGATQLKNKITVYSTGILVFVS